MLGCNKIKTKRETILASDRGLRLRSPNTCYVIYLRALTGHLTSLGLSFSICKIEITCVASSRVRTICSACDAGPGCLFVKRISDILSGDRKVEEKIHHSSLPFTRLLGKMLYNITDPPHSPVGSWAWSSEKGNNFPEVPQLVSG